MNPIPSSMYPIETILKYIGLFALCPICKIIHSHIKKHRTLQSICESIEYKYIYWHWIPVGWKIIKIEMRYISVSQWKNVSLPETLEHFVMHKMFDSPIELPKKLLRLVMGYYFDQPIVLPETLEYLIMKNYFNQPIVLPDPLKHLTMGDFFDQPIVLPEALEYLSMGKCFNQHIVLPNGLKHLIMGYRFNKIIIFPNKLRFLVIGDYYGHKLILPESLETIAFSYYVTQDILVWYFDNLPNSVSIVILDNYVCDYPLKNLPNSIKYLIEKLFMTKPRVFNNKCVEMELEHDELDKVDKIINKMYPIEE